MKNKKRLFLLCSLLIIVNGCIVPGYEVWYVTIDKKNLTINGWKVNMTIYPVKKDVFDCWASISFYPLINNIPNESPYRAKIDSFEISFGDIIYTVENPNNNFIQQNEEKKENIAFGFEASYNLRLFPGSLEDSTRTLLHVNSDINYIDSKIFLSFKHKETGEIEHKIINIKLKKEIDRWTFIIPME